MDKKSRRGRPTKAQALEIKWAHKTIAAFRAAAAARKLKTRSEAAKKGYKNRKRKTLDFKDPDFFKKIGKRGGNGTVARMGENMSEYFRAIAVLGHQTCREKRAEAERRAEELERRAKMNARR